jgi:hypothetical protein
MKNHSQSHTSLGLTFAFRRRVQGGGGLKGEGRLEGRHAEDGAKISIRSQ